MMKKLLFIFIILATACGKLLDAPQPLTIIERDEALKNTDALEAALVGSYDILQSYFLFGGQWQLAGEMLAANVERSGRGNIVFEENQLLARQLSNINLISGNMWGDAYKAIARSNNILAALPTINDGKIEKNRDRITGEALFIRAIAHYELVKYVGSLKTGLGIPIVLAPAANALEKPTRNTISEVYAQVIQDLKEAEKLLPKENNDFGRATSWAAKAYLSRVYLQTENYQEALNAANDVITNSSFRLNNNPQDAFTPSTDRETIFRLLSNANDNSAASLNTAFNPATAGRFAPARSFMAFMRTNPLDKRLNTYFSRVDIADWVAKYDITRFSPPFIHLPLLRLSEMYLVRAEARLQLTPAAIQQVRLDLNTVRLRAGLPADNATSGKDFLLEAIYEERRREFAFEGDDFHTRKRLKKSIGGLPFDSDKLVFPISQRELLANPNLEQNPSY